jgi:hypothetical protein
MSSLAIDRLLVKPRKPHVATRPVCGRCRWAVQPTDSHPGCLVITSADARGKVTVSASLVYVVVEYGRVLGFQLKKATGEAYDLAADLSSCDCPDATFHPERPGGCKHQKALAAVLKAMTGEGGAA